MDLGPLGAVAEQLQRTEVESALDQTYTRGTAKMTANFVELWPTMYDAAACRFGKASRCDDRQHHDVCRDGCGRSGRHSFIVNNPYLLAVLPSTVNPPVDRLPFYLSAKSVHDLTTVDLIRNRFLRLFAPFALNQTLGKRLNRAANAEGSRTRRSVQHPGRSNDHHQFDVWHRVSARSFPTGVCAWADDLAARAATGSVQRLVCGGPPVVYANLGTLAMASRDVVVRMLSAFESTEFRVLWVLKRNFRKRSAR